MAKVVTDATTVIYPDLPGGGGGGGVLWWAKGVKAAGSTVLPANVPTTLVTVSMSGMVGGKLLSVNGTCSLWCSNSTASWVSGSVHFSVTDGTLEYATNDAPLMVPPTPGTSAIAVAIPGLWVPVIPYTNLMLRVQPNVDGGEASAAGLYFVQYDA